MTHKQIEESREIRLWIRDILVPAAIVIAGVPEIRKPISDKINSFISKCRKRKSVVLPIRGEVEENDQCQMMFTEYDENGKPIAGRYIWK